MKYFLAILLVTVTVIFTSCGSKTDTADNTPQEFCIPDSLMENISLDTIRSATVVSDLKLSGKITFNEDNVSKVFPLVSGNVTEVKASLGDYVQKGQLLAVVRSSDMANYFNDYKSAQSELAIAKKNLDVVNDMHKSGITSEKDLLDAQNEYNKAVAQLNKVNEVLRIYGRGAKAADDSIGSRYSITSPISGFIVEKNVTEGMQLRADDANNLFTISDLKDVWATANVYEGDIGRIKVGSDAEITTLSYPDKKFTGKIERVSNILNPETSVMTVKVRLHNPDYTLKPGMFANISVIFPETEKKLYLPSSAVLFDDSKNYVVLFRKRCDVAIEPVTIYKSIDDKTYITDSSFHEGDRFLDKNVLFVFTALKKL